MRIIKKMLVVVCMAAVCSTGSIALTWMLPIELQLLGMAIAFGFLVREFWMEPEDGKYCEYRDRFIRH